jgi:hypothetical protein
MSGYINDTNPSKLGGGVPGVQHKLLGGSSNSNSYSGMEGGGERSSVRFQLRNSFGRSGWLKRAVNNNNLPLVITPFRLAYNAGDINGTQNEAPLSQLPKVNQLNGENVSRLNAKGDSVRNDGRAGYSGNPKYVYDSSDYVRFKKLQASNRNYNDSSFGGSNNGAYVFLRRVRR